MSRENIGYIGEDLVAKYLKSQDFIILRRNYHSKFGEIDIIAESREYLLFVEVKTRKKGSPIPPAMAVTSLKQRKIALTAFDFISKARIDTNFRFDIAEVEYSVDENGEMKFNLNYIKNAFTTEVLNDEAF